MPPIPAQCRRTYLPPRGALQTVATGGIPRGAIEVPLTEGALAVPGRHSKEHVMHGGARPESGMDDPGPNSKGGHQHTSHRPVRDPIKGGGGADRHSPPHQPADAQCPPGFQFRKRYRDSYNGVKARPVAF